MTQTTHSHEVHHDDGAGFAFASGFMLLISAFVIALIIAGIALLVAQPWDDGDGGVVDEVVPIEQPVENPGGGDGGGNEGGQ